jgi:hypothetical protein
VEFFTRNGTSLETPAPEGLTILKWDENRWQALLDQQSGARDWLQRQGIEDISLTRLTLEDLFVALVKEDESV